MINGYLYLVSKEGLKKYDQDFIDKTEKIDFFKEFEEYFSDLKEENGHYSIFRENCKLYFGTNGEGLVNCMQVQYAGIDAIKELIKLGNLKKWSVMDINPVNPNDSWINLNFIHEVGVSSIEEWIKLYH